MPKQKHDKYDQIHRTYPVKCKKCGAPVYISEEDFTCFECGACMCPDCLVLLEKGSTTANTWSGSNGTLLEVSCKKCGFLIVDIDL